MSEITELTERQKMILKAVIDAHVRSGEPIGSKLVAEMLPVSLSSATIRNVMNELERLGYLEQPHTSAGRVPAGLGYRTYVSTLMTDYSLSETEKQAIDTSASSRLVGVDGLLKGAAQTISQMTDYTALAIRPRHRRVLVMSFKLLPMNDYGVLMIMQTSVGVVKTRFIEMGFKVSEDISVKLETALNTHLACVSIEDVTPTLVAEMERELTVIAPLLVPIMRAFMEEIGTLGGGALTVEGINKMLRYPEYSSLESITGLLGALEKKDYILNVVSTAQNDAVNVYISPEGENEQFKGTSLVFKTVTENNLPVAAIGVIGPCRMDYPKVISTVDYMTDKIKDAIKADTSKKLPK